MRKLLLAAAAMMSVVWLALVAIHMPVSQTDVFGRPISSDEPLSGYGVYVNSAVQRR
ncbi:MAG: hypothetical protein K0S00_3084 [Xanthobacteraceae bacterium]|jgi:predicted metal-binding membrane protein|nr:hypothetical protein [Xanthobacteraceae bacterium]